MFSDHVQKIDALPHKTLLGVAAGLVMVCQLIAMALVADGQVAKAKARDAHHAHQQMALAQCMDSRIGVARHDCIQQVNAMAGPAQVAYNPQDTQTAAVSQDMESTALPTAAPVPGFMSAAFAAAR